MGLTLQEDLKDVEGLGEAVIGNEARVEREKTHEYNAIASAHQDVNQLGKRIFL